MKTAISGPFNKNIFNLMRDLGYHFQKEDASSKELSFTRPRLGYPRLHLFAKMEKDSLLINLHLDQKRPVYENHTAHSGDYDGPVIEREMARILQSIKNANN